MISIKHVMDTPEPADGLRLWVEPVGLTRDLIAWCEIDAQLTGALPPKLLWKWFEADKLDYDEFRGRYHMALDNDSCRAHLMHLVRDSKFRNYTLLHQGVDPEHNTASALHEFLSELSSYCQS